MSRSQCAWEGSNFCSQGKRYDLSEHRMFKPLLATHFVVSHQKFYPKNQGRILWISWNDPRKMNWICYSYVRFRRVSAVGRCINFHLDFRRRLCTEWSKWVRWWTAHVFDFTRNGSSESMRWILNVAWKYSCARGVAVCVWSKSIAIFTRRVVVMMACWLARTYNGLKPNFFLTVRFTCSLMQTSFSLSYSKAVRMQCTRNSVSFEARYKAFRLFDTVVSSFYCKQVCKARDLCKWDSR